MASLIDVQSHPHGQRRIHARLGDVLQFAASGARLAGSEGALELLGAFGEAVAVEGQVARAEGAPSRVLVRACAVGAAQVELLTGAFGGPAGPAQVYDVIVED